MNTENKSKKTNLLEVLQKLIAEEVGEAIRQAGKLPFDMKHFRSLQDLREIYRYASVRLEPLGAGSSRAAFLLSSGKVLKIAHGKENAGKAQNQEEVNVFTNPLAKPVVAKVFDYDPNFRWIISELVKPLDNWSYVQKKFGVSYDQFVDFIGEALRGDGIEAVKEEMRKSLYKRMVKPGYNYPFSIQWRDNLPFPRKNMFDANKEVINYYDYIDNPSLPLPPKIKKAMQAELKQRNQEFADQWKQTEKLLSKLGPFVEGALAMSNEIDFNLSDILGRPEHLGVTADDRLVILDYGFSEEIGEKFYYHSSQSQSGEGSFSDSGDSDYSYGNSQVISEGGLGGHMAYIHEDLGLTFGDIKKIFRTLASRKNILPVVEKVDGQNIFFTFNLQEHRVKFARNKSHIASGGIGRNDIKNKWADIPKVQTAYLEAYDVLQQTLGGLNPRQLQQVFGNSGDIWYSAEVISEANPNVINYDGNHLVIHKSALSVDKNGKAVTSNSPETYSAIVDLIGGKQMEMAKNSWQIHGQLVRQLFGVKDVKKFAEGFDILNFLQAKYGLNDNSTVGDMVYQSVKNSIPEIDSWPEEAVRWLSSSDKKIELRKAKILQTLQNHEIALGSTPKERNRILSSLISRADNSAAKAMHNLGMSLELLTEQVLQDLNSLLVANPKQEAERLRMEIQKIKNEMQQSKDMHPDVRFKLEDRLARLGGVEKIKNAIEGVVFRWKGQTYKLTYPFGVINQILGLFRYGN